MMNLPETPLPFVFGHRGSPRRALENTLDSFDFAEAEGANGFELDVRLTSDGEVVVHHDPELFLNDRRMPVSSLTSLDLVNAPVRKGEFSGLVPTLRDVFLRFGGSVRYLVELKTCPASRPSLLEFRVANLIHRFHLGEKALVLSFSSDSLRRIREIDSGIETCLLYDGTAYRPEGRLWPDLPKGCTRIAPNLPLVSERLFSEAKESGTEVFVWTVNAPEEAVRLATLGATGLISDFPGELVPALRASGRPLCETGAA
jgi:glycerophosphoryl diester phosphodiesterase